MRRRPVAENEPMSDDILPRLEQALDRIRPAVQMDGGDIHLVEWRASEGLVRVALSGACQGCHNVALTMTMGVERVLKQFVPEVVSVETV